MSEIVRLYKYKDLFAGRRFVTKAELVAALEISEATFKRDIAKLRDQLHVPIEFNRDLGGYVMASGHTDTELPGLWFSQEELLALVTIQQLLTQLEPGLLGAKLKPLHARLSQLMDKHGLASQDVAKRIRILNVGKRNVIAKSFEVVAAATMARKRLRIWHFSRQNGKTTEREVSPQRLVHYRDNWYLDAWCHLRDDVRSFSIDAITQIKVMDEPAKEVSEKSINDSVDAGYGIFGGAPKGWAKLKFTPERARWVAGETWHPNQRTHTEADGSYVLEIPYSDERELLGDLLRFGADVEVLEPADLRNRIKRALHAAGGRYV
jgi:predicted DNA-binding transcriptional regulator YafY